MKITDHVHLVPDTVANVFILIDPDGLTVIDTGLPRSERKILDYITNLGRSHHDVKRILITHSDLDHVGSLAALQKASGALTYASQIEAEAIAAGQNSRPPKPGFSMAKAIMAAMRPFYKATPFQVAEYLTDGQVLPALGGLRVVETAGHSPGHVSLFAPGAGILFCGDSLVTDQNGIHGSRSAVTWEAEKAREAERKQAALGARIVCPGHGPVVMEAGSKFKV